LSKNDIVESGILERYILGTTSAEESSFVQQKCKEFPELNQELDAIEMALVNYAVASSPLKAVSKDKIKEKVFTEINSNTQTRTEAKVIPMNTMYYRLGIAASALLLITSMVYNMMMRNQLEDAKDELAKMQDSESQMNNAMKKQEDVMLAMNDKLILLSDPATKNVELKGMNSLADKKAMVRYNPNTHQVYFEARNLQLADKEKQYQLWAIVDGKPVDMGMIDLDGENVFQKMKNMHDVQAFAVTIEKKGGSDNPTMDTMCLLGNV
jgi:anti-sigma-K factor RskA